MRRFSKVFRVADYPRCFNNADEYSRWLEADRACSSMPTARAESHCTDCTPSYKTEMLLQERCAHPLVEFRKAPDGFIEGFREQIAKAA